MPENVMSISKLTKKCLLQTPTHLKPIMLITSKPDLQVLYPTFDTFQVQPKETLFQLVR